MDFVAGAEWGVRIFMGRAPVEADRRLADGCASFEDLRARLLATDEVARWHYHMQAPKPDEAGLDYKDGFRWAFRLILRRELSEDQVEALSPAIRSVADLQTILTSRECEAVSPDLQTLADAVVFRAFAPYALKAPPQGAFTNCIGATTQVKFLPAAAAGLAGATEWVPGPGTPGFYGVAEWVGTLKSVLEARDRFVAIELGAGWAPWLVNSALAAKKRGIEQVHLIGVEGSADHHAYMVQNLVDNGLNPNDHQLLHAVIGAEDGHAYFPKLIDPSLDYGANAVFDESEKGAAVQRGELERVDCVGLAGLLERTGRVDLMHMDIQGHEVVVLNAAMDQMDRLVRRIVIGTHSRMIDATLFELFSSHGWYLERELPTKLVQTPEGQLSFPVDGEQVWRNDRV